MKRVKYIYVLMLAAIFSGQITAQSFQVKNQSVDLRSKITERGLSVRNQNPRGTCTIFATTFLIEFLTARDTNAKNLDFSEEYLNAVANRATGNKFDGAFFDEAIAGYEEFGIVDEKSAPYKSVFDSNYLMGSDQATLDLLALGNANRGYEGTVSISANVPNKLPGLSDAQLLALINELDKGNPVAIGHGGDASANTKTVKLSNGFSALASYDLNNLINPYAHTVPLVGYQIDGKLPGGGYFIFRNSWGASFGDKGYGYMTFKYVQDYSYDTLIVKKPSIWTMSARPDIKVIEKMFLKKKDILIQNNRRMQPVKVPFLKIEGMRVLDKAVRN